MRELWSKIWEALLSALPITAIVYILALTPFFDLNSTELITFSVGLTPGTFAHAARIGFGQDLFPLRKAEFLRFL